MKKRNRAMLPIICVPEIIAKGMECFRSVLVWGRLFLRDGRLRALIPLRS